MRSAGYPCRIIQCCHTSTISARRYSAATPAASLQEDAALPHQQQGKVPLASVSPTVVQITAVVDVKNPGATPKLTFEKEWKVRSQARAPEDSSVPLVNLVWRFTGEYRCSRFGEGSRVRWTHGALGFLLCQAWPPVESSAKLSQAACCTRQSRVNHV